MALEDVLQQVRVELEEKIKRQLTGLQGLVARPLYNSRMPLHFEISTDSETFELGFLNDGDVRLSRGHSASPDVRLESDAQTLEELFQNPSPARFKEMESRNMIRIISLTQKGKDAEAYIRHYLAA
ncbi:MAG: hypothetical protein ACLP5V_02005 [Candidatus Bathyarchaeia archaeon]